MPQQMRYSHDMHMRVNLTGKYLLDQEVTFKVVVFSLDNHRTCTKVLWLFANSQHHMLKQKNGLKNNTKEKFQT